MSLYLTALELDPIPSPIEDLRFDNLRDKVLFNARRSSEPCTDDPIIGSLGDAIDRTHESKYDIVVSNPPWTSGTASIGNKYTEICQDVLRRKRLNGWTDFRVPDNNPDIPFLLKSSAWAKPGGTIAMAMPARLLLKTEHIPSAARKVVFDLIEVKGIISGVSIAKTNVWKGTDQPFILLFASNKSVGEYSTSVICPHYDADLNNKGEFRIDGGSSTRVRKSDWIDRPWLWKALLVGTSLDIEVVEKVLARSNGISISSYWEKMELANGQGFVVASGQTQHDSTNMIGLPEIRTQRIPRFMINTKTLPTFNRKSLHAPRSIDIYRAPLLLFRQSPGLHREEGFAHLADKDVAYSSSYYGYSSKGHPQEDFLVRYLQVIVHSSLLMHYVLMTDSQFGAERNKIQKKNIDSFPLVPPEKLTSSQRKKLSHVSQLLLANKLDDFSVIDRLVSNIYGIDEYEMQVIKDTLDVCQAYRATSGSRACKAPTQFERDEYLKIMNDLLSPFIMSQGANVSIPEYNTKGNSNSTFVPLIIGRSRGMDEVSSLYEKALMLADETAASHVYLATTSGDIVVAIRNQYRYWTKSRARLVVSEVLRNYLSIVRSAS